MSSTPGHKLFRRVWAPSAHWSFLRAGLFTVANKLRSKVWASLPLDREKGINNLKTCAPTPTAPFSSEETGTWQELYVPFAET